MASTNCACSCCWNTAPVLPAQADRTVTELATLMVNNAASDADLPAQSLTYTLLDPPSGAGITNGVITWTPTEAQGPGSYTLSTQVTDSGTPALSPTNSFTVVVNETNNPPSLPGQSNRTILEMTTLTVTNSEAHGEDGWFETGDVATIDRHGYVAITDRTKDVIKSGGEWISSIDLENTAAAHPAWPRLQ